MSGFMTKNAHAFGVGAAFDFEHLLAFQPHQTGVREVERNRDARHSVRRKPFFGKPNMWLEAYAATIQLVVKAFYVRLEERPANLDGQVADARFEQLLIREPMPGEAITHALTGVLTAGRRQSSWRARRTIYASKIVRIEELDDSSQLVRIHQTWT